MNDILLSIIIPCYNGEYTLKRCVKSILSGVTDEIISIFEIVIVDDGSSDHTADVCRELKNTVSNLQYYYQQNRGVSAARNKGLEVSKGLYISFVDADDVCMEFGIQTMIETIKSDMISDLFAFEIMRSHFGHNHIITRKKNSIYVSYDDIGKLINDDIIERNYIYGKAYARQVIMDNNISFNEKFRLGEDSLFVLQFLLFMTGSVNVSEACVYKYFDDTPSSLSKKTVDNIDQIYGSIYDCCDALRRKYKTYSFYGTKARLIATMEISNLYVEEGETDRKIRIATISKLMKDYELKKDIKCEKAIGIKENIIKLGFRLGSPYIIDAVYMLAKVIRRTTKL